MSKSIGVVYTQDQETTFPKTLKAVHQKWEDVAKLKLPGNARVLCVKLMHEEGTPPSTFTDQFSGHDVYGASFLPGMSGSGGITVMQYDTPGSGTGLLAKSMTQGAALDGSEKTPLTLVERGFEELALMGSEAVFISYSVLATDFTSLLDEAFEFTLPSLP